MSVPQEKKEELDPLVIVLWVTAALFLVAVIGFAVAPGLALVWLVLLVLAVAAAPQTIVVMRRERKKQEAGE